MFPFHLLGTTGYLADTSSYLNVTSGYLIATTGYFWLPLATSGYFWLLLVTSRYFSLLLVPRFSKNDFTDYFFQVHGSQMCTKIKILVELENKYTKTDA